MAYVNIEAYLSLEGEGRIDLQEELSESTTLVDVKSDAVELEITYISESELKSSRCCMISLRDYGIENSETKRVFHAATDVFLSREQMGTLHRYLGFLLSLPELPDA